MASASLARFLRTFHPTLRNRLPGSGKNSQLRLPFTPADLTDFLTNYGGSTFNDGVYRLHRLDEIPHWTRLIEEAFPTLTGHIVPFGFDWLGREFVVDNQLSRDHEPLVRLVEPGTGQLFEIPETFTTFHEVELVDDPEAA